MLDWLREQLGGTPTAEDAKNSPNLTLACACLLVEIMQADQVADESELQVIDNYLIKQFDLSQPAAVEQRRQAVRYQQESHDLFQFTQLINEHWCDTEKRQLITHLWGLAYSDGSIDQLEEHLIRRIADLLYLRHSDFINAKLAAKTDSNH